MITDWSVTEAREELAEELTNAGFVVTDSTPRAVEPPLVVISPAEPYFTPTDDWSADTVVVTLDLFVVLAAAEGQAATEAAQVGAARVLAALPEDWQWRSISAPFKASNVGGHPAVRVRVDTVAALPAPPTENPL